MGGANSHFGHVISGLLLQRLIRGFEVARDHLVLGRTANICVISFSIIVWKALQRCFCYLGVEFYFKTEVLGIQGDDVAISIMQVSLGEVKRRKNNHQTLIWKMQCFIRGSSDLESQSRRLEAVLWLSNHWNVTSSVNKETE